MQGESVRAKMESLRLACAAEIAGEQREIDALASSFLESLQSAKAKARETVQNQGRLSKLKSSLQEAEDELVKALAVKTRTEAKRMAIMDSICAVKSRQENLRRSLQDQKARRDKCAAIVSQELIALTACEEKNEQRIGQKVDIQEAISWYNKVLGFQIEGGNGVKFMFNNIDIKNPHNVYFFTIRHANDTYTLLECDPPLDGTKELIHELNKSNDLYKFVRIMRRKFQEFATQGTSPSKTTVHQEYSINSLSAPVTSVSTEISESPARKKYYEIEYGEVERDIKKVNRGTSTRIATSSGSASSVRRSSRRVKLLSVRGCLTVDV
ncbi:kinetochore protein SPC25 homolog isoform X1 [Eucalyptus grandis]|uniref:kinetochore protein SPC25 homolog isoform X1 n=1 Tax=Eucalyptus grandis TaxID=71139 RepID=UPI00192E804E|nr:kinetochore protein SPC25 homolog isoform X1 [Eucalyptus grandis]